MCQHMSFLFMAAYYSTVWAYHFVYSLVYRHLGCLHLLAIILTIIILLAFIENIDAMWYFSLSNTDERPQEYKIRGKFFSL